MTVTQRKPQPQPDEVQNVHEPGIQFQCDSCSCDLTHTIRIKCADPICEPGDGVDICPPCFCAGKEFANHKRNHPYRVIEFNSYPIFTEDWGADEELLLLKGIASQGFGNWRKIAEHVGTRTKEEVEQHYNAVYVNSETWPLPPMDRTFNIEPEQFHTQKRRRISEMSALPLPPVKPAPVSLPGIHEVATFLPGRLEFEHELDHDAEDLIKDLEFGVCLEWDGDQIMEDENDLDVKARLKLAEEKRLGPTAHKGPVTTNGGSKFIGGKGPIPNRLSNGSIVNGHLNGSVAPPPPPPKVQPAPKTEDSTEDDVDEVTQPPPIETKDSLAFKLTLIEMYKQRVEKRDEAKALMFDRGLLEYKKMQAMDKKRPREERELLHRLRPFARLQTSADYEVFTADILYESVLRKRIQELQMYRRQGLVTQADIDKYDADLIKRNQAKSVPRDFYASQFRGGNRASSGPDPRRNSHASFDSETKKSDEREETPKVSGPGHVKSRPAPLNLSNSPSLHLLTAGEQTLCSQLRILPKPYLVIKETLVREYARRGGKLRRREARDLVKVDVLKTARVWDFLVQAGFLKINQEPVGPSAPTQESGTVNGVASSSSQPQSAVGSPMKDIQTQSSPRPSFAVPPTNGTANGMSTSPGNPW